jgi:hypothetical protein
VISELICEELELGPGKGRAGPGVGEREAEIISCSPVSMLVQVLLNFGAGLRLRPDRRTLDDGPASGPVFNRVGDFSVPVWGVFTTRPQCYLNFCSPPAFSYSANCTTWVISKV